jgi:hypothetical protein
VKWYASSPGTEWGFCGRCGTPFAYRSEATAPGRIYLTAASLEGPLDRIPSAHYSFEEQVGWGSVDPHLPRFRGKSEERWDPSV